MRALLLDRELRLAEDHPEPQPRPDEALVHVRRAGICATDLQLVRGYAGFTGILGHEFVGEVDRDDPSELAGRRVVADINVGCGACRECAAKDPHHCRARTVLGIRSRPGVFAQRVAIPRANLIPVPDQVDDDQAVFAEPLAAALHVLDDLPLARTEPAYVIGDGKLGLLIALALHAAGQRVCLVGRHPAKLALAQAQGIAVVLEHELTEQRRIAHAVVEASGRTEGLTRALALLVPRGTLILKTTITGATALPLASIVVDELRLIGSRCGDPSRAIELLAEGRVDPRPLIQARFGLEQGLAALDLAARPGVLKVLLDPLA